MTLVERLRDPQYAGEFQHLRSWSEIDTLLNEAASRIEALEAELARRGEPVGYVEPDVLAELAAGRIGGYIYPKGTLRPENEMPLYTAPASAQWRPDVCATEGCENIASHHFIRGGVGSHYCRNCYLKVQALPAPPLPEEG